AKMMPKRRRSGTGRGRRTAEEWLHEDGAGARSSAQSARVLPARAAADEIVRAAPRRRRGVVDRHRGRGRPLEECKSHGGFPPTGGFVPRGADRNKANCRISISVAFLPQKIAPARLRALPQLGENRGTDGG